MAYLLASGCNDLVNMFMLIHSNSIWRRVAAARCIFKHDLELVNLYGQLTLVLGITVSSQQSSGYTLHPFGHALIAMRMSGGGC